MYGDMEMIKQDYTYSYTSGKGEWVPSKAVSCRSRFKSRWYTLYNTYLGYGWKKKEEPMLAPTILSTWSK